MVTTRAQQDPSVKARAQASKVGSESPASSAGLAGCPRARFPVHRGSIDILPTLARLVDAPLPLKPIDGRDVWPVISGQPGAKHPQSAYFIYYNQGELQAVISEGWKLFLPHTSRTLAGRAGGTDGTPSPYQPLPVGLELYHLQTDPGERTNVIDQHPDQLQRLLHHAESARVELGDSLTGRHGRGVRQAARVDSDPDQ